jgi:hypothetical protein
VKDHAKVTGKGTTHRAAAPPMMAVVAAAAVLLRAAAVLPRQWDGPSKGDPICSPRRRR